MQQETAYVKGDSIAVNFINNSFGNYKILLI